MDDELDFDFDMMDQDSPPKALDHVPDDYDSFDDEFEARNENLTKKKILNRYSEIQKESEMIDQVAKEIRTLMLICQKMEQCYSKRISENCVVRSFVEARYMFNESLLLIITISNESEYDIDGWSLCVQCESLNDTMPVNLSQAIQLELIPSKILKSFELSIASKSIRNLPVLIQLKLFKRFEFDGAEKLFRIPLDPFVASLWSLAQIHKDCSRITATNFDFALRIPHPLIDLLCGCPDTISTTNVFRAFLPTSITQNLQNVEELNLSFPTGPSKWEFARMRVTRESTYYTVTIATETSKFVAQLRNQLKLWLIVEMSKFKSRPVNAMAVLPELGDVDEIMTSAFVVGATGAVGSQLVKLLAECEKFSKVVIFARREVEGANGDKFIQETVDFEKISEESEAVKDIDVAFCALGTTRAKSGADGFYKVDHDYVLNSAKLAKDNGVKSFVLISSVGANENSMFLYPKTKGQVEREITELGFEKFVIIRPGMIEAKREEPRFIEGVMNFILKPAKMVCNSIGSTSTQIAQAMIMAARTEETGTLIWNNAKIIEEAKKFEAN
ncbi:unnamed protein product [Caenorhabditis bovis]|uniref:Protein HTATIP2 n=1 Tax=Caenorhabditis bovis TaxID=2654633 RepID=A0A8S1FEX8_9PELO|nr:unnamed protein product [Caenorhabditis bovis]